MDGEQGRDAAAGPVDRAEQVARALRRDHPDVDDAGRVDPPEVDVEAVGEHQQVAGAQVRRDLRVVDRLLGGVRDEDHDHVGGLDRIGDVGDAQARLRGERPALGSRRQPDDDVHAGFVEVQGVGVALRPVADDRDGLPGQCRRDRRRCRSTSSLSSLDRLLDGSGAPGHHDGSGPDQLLDAIGPDQRDERVDLGLGAGHLHDDRAIGQVHDPAA